MSSERQILEQWAKQNPGMFEGLKQAIAGAEGTIRDGVPGYNVMFGGGRFKDFTRHPDKVIRTPGYASAAAGAYKFMPATWGEVQKKLGLSDFRSSISRCWNASKSSPKAFAYGRTCSNYKSRYVNTRNPGCVGT